MQAIRPLNSLLVFFFLMISGCEQHSEPINWVVLKGTVDLAPIKQEKKTKAFHNTRYLSVPIEQSSGNPMRDALEALFNDNEIENYYTSLQLVSSGKETGKTFYHFKGKAKSKEALELAGLSENFTVTIGRNKIGLNYSIEFL